MPGDYEVPSENKTDSKVVAALDRLRALVEQAHRDADVVPEIQQILEDNPEIWQHLGDLAGHVEKIWVGLLADKNNPQIAESLIRKIEALKIDLGGEAPSPLEKLLLDRICSTWIQTKYYELAVAATHATKDSSGRQADSVQKRLDAAQRRHLAAIKSLVDLRKLPRSAQEPSESGTDHYRASHGQTYRSSTEGRQRLRAAVPDELCVTVPFVDRLSKNA